jgi:hypothetical protein
MMLISIKYLADQPELVPLLSKRMKIFFYSLLFSASTSATLSTSLRLCVKFFHRRLIGKDELIHNRTQPGGRRRH